MKKIHLICNSHIDPIWQWDWEEGAAAALSTFRSACDLSDEFDYIFCHNEVTLYKYIEEYAPELFARIKTLVEKGKWHIMGGWYLQPDCNMPSGESFVRQILMGRKYFSEKFGATPTTAINFDPFGHTRGLVQIIKKCGQDSYILCRPGTDPIPCKQFVWEGFDGSKIKVFAATDGYNSSLGTSINQIKRRIARSEDDVVCVLWGVGNHGGGPSRKDLEDIKNFMEESGDDISHSTPEKFFDDINPKIIHSKSLHTIEPGCYTSMSRIKQKHAELENALYTAEKMCSAASLRGLMEYPSDKLYSAAEDLMNAEFHDVLPGTCIKAGEENGLRLLEHGLHNVNLARASAYFALTGCEKKAAEGEYPFLVFNPEPYTQETEVVCEMTLADQNWDDDTITVMHVYGEDGKEIVSQQIKEESCLNLDWRKRIIFRAPLKPLSLTRFSVYPEVVKKTQSEKTAVNDGIVLDVPGKHVEIDVKTGLMRSYKINGKEYIKDGAFCPYFYDDTPDPFGMSKFQLEGMGRNGVPFELIKNPDGPFSGMEPVRIIEDGEIYLGVECFFELMSTKIRIEYDIYKNTPYTDIKLDVFMNDAGKMLKLSIPVNYDGEYIGQAAFGTDTLYNDGRECVAQRFTAVKDNAGECFALLNKGTYGSSYNNGTVFLSLLRGTTYCAHIIKDRPIIPDDKYTKKTDMGERNFSFRILPCRECELDRMAEEFNNPPYALNVFPVESGKTPLAFDISVSDRDITLVTMKKSDTLDGYILRLMNNFGEEKRAEVSLNGQTVGLVFGKYEVKTLIYNRDGLKVSERLII